MRKGAIYFLIVLAVVSGAILYFFRDRYFERAVESACESANGAKVEIDNFHFSAFRLTCKFDRLQWTDPKDTWTNLFETGPVEFGLELRPLFWKKIIVREMKISDIMLGTKRATNGWLPAPPPEEPGLFDEVTESIRREIAAIPLLNLDMLKKKINLDSLLEVNQVVAVQSVQGIRSDIDTTAAKWQQFVKTYDAKARIAALQTQAKAIDLQNLKTMDDLTTNLQRVEKLRSEAAALQNEITENRENAEQDFGRISGAIKNIDNLVAQDFAMAKQKFGFADFNVKDIGKMLFGNPFAGRFTGIMRYIDLGREYLPTAKMLMSVNKVESPPRFKGQDVTFPRYFAYPEFLLRHALISGATNVDQSDALHLKGEMWGITNEPPVYGKPTIFNVQVYKEESNAYQIRGILDHTADVANDTLHVRAANFRLGNIDLKQDKTYLPARLIANRGEVNAIFALSGKNIHGRVSMTIDKVEFQFTGDAVDRLIEAIRSTFRPVEQLRLSAEVKASAGDLKLQISSNLDEMFAARLRDALKENLDRAQQEIRARIDQEVATHRQQVEALWAEKQKLIMTELNQYQAMVDEQVAVVENKKKEFEKRIKDEQERVTGEAKKKLKKKLEGFIKP
jgi:uncharacterized protein (TIGR03545 family)